MTIKTSASKQPDYNPSSWETNKAALLARLKRAEGQIRGIQSMIEADVECEQVAQQMTATRRALDRAFYQMLSCVIERELSCSHLDTAGARERLNYVTQLLGKYG